MSREEIQSVTCDRCGELHRYRAGDPVATKWIRAFVASEDGREIVGTRETPADLCPPCGGDLRAWLEQGRSRESK